ncbi:MFS monocarboxylate transporter [Cordyceps fumosorosea ARSEF 2679]|uniref:MFS monocarboxylate transporter n=1 Tax=Cordyceps fumosorosea (strain ARSEF 2679) TaxID=1081104 RepID=A0A167V9A0_CORFA|nr:MFS monocarboxylate transporter [Cordyceps fumosorosea ARSEF 2679]OAA62368.1 MFS monocarboxylate transporter [Cordyceps fumosorosea ARSEF 2679]
MAEEDKIPMSPAETEEPVEYQGSDVDEDTAKEENADEAAEDGGSDVDEDTAKHEDAGEVADEEDANQDGEEVSPKDDTAPAELVYNSLTGLPLGQVIAKPFRPYGTPLTVAAIVHINDAMAPGYNARHVQSAAREIGLGVRTDVSIILGDYQVPSIDVQGLLEHEHGTIRVFRLGIPINTENFVYTHQKPPAARRKPGRTFLREVAKIGGDYAKIGTQMGEWARQVKQEDVVRITLSRAGQGEDVFMWPDLDQDLAPHNPFAAMIPAHIRDLTGDTVQLPTAESHDVMPKPVPITSLFFDQTHHYASLLAGVCDEMRHNNLLASVGAQVNSFARFFELPSPWTETQEEQMANYGQILADGAATEFYMVVEITDENRELLGSVGDSVVITTSGIQAQSHPQPNPTDAVHITRVVEDLMTRYQDAENHALSALFGEEATALAAANQQGQDGGPQQEVFHDDATRADIILDAIYNSMRKTIASFVSNAAAREWAAANPSDVAMSDFARYVYEVTTQLRRRSCEDQDSYRERLRAWVTAHPAVDGENRHSERGLSFRGIRVMPPPGVTLHHAMFLVRRPLQPDYPKAYKAPYLMMSFPLTAYPENLSDFSGACFPTPGGRTRDADANQAEDTMSAGCVVVQISVQLDSATLKHELKALHIMHQLRAATDGGILNGLADRDDVPTSLLTVLAETKAGKVVVSGCPGAGKSRLLRIIAELALRGPYRPKGDSALHVAPAVTQLNEQTRAEVDAAIDGFDAMELWDRENMEIQDTEQEAQPVQEDQPTQDQAAEQEAQSAQMNEDQTPKAPEKRQGFVLLAKPSPAILRPRGEKRVQILWSAPANKIADDAAQRLIKAGIVAMRAYTFSSELIPLVKPPPKKRQELTANPDKPMTERYFTNHRNELFRQNAAQLTAANDPISLSSQVMVRVDPADRRMVVLARARELYETDPHMYSLGKESATTAAKSLLEEVAMTAQVLCCTPVAARTLGNNTQYVPSLIFSDESGRLTETQFFVLTSCWPHTATFIVGDPQQSNAVVPSKHQVLRFPATGEDEAVTVWQDRFGAQREVSLLQRAEENNKVDLYLRTNYRSSGGIIKWPSRQFYRGEMTVARANQRLAKPQLVIMEYLKQYSPDLRFCGLFIDLPDMFETQVAKSYTSSTTARFCVELAVDLWRKLPIPSRHDDTRRCKILIITGYSVQAAEMKHPVSKIGQHCVPEGALQVRTVDDSPSHEAEIVIVDFPRKSKVGFLDEPRRVNVACTRAHYCTIYVGNVGNLERSKLLDNLISMHRQSDALITLQQRPEFCDRCFGTGHTRRGCKDAIGENTLICHCCRRGKRDHSGRTCRRTNVTASFDISKPLSPLDSTTRDLLAGAMVSRAKTYRQEVADGRFAIDDDGANWRSTCGLPQPRDDPNDDPNNWGEAAAEPAVETAAIADAPAADAAVADGWDAPAADAAVADGWDAKPVADATDGDWGFKPTTGESPNDDGGW